jgi:signal transduction histidine kinase
MAKILIVDDCNLSRRILRGIHRNSRSRHYRRLRAFRFKRQLSPPPVKFCQTKDRLQQIFWHLLSNAVKLTPAKGRVEIRLSVVVAHGGWRMGQWAIRHRACVFPQWR